MGGTGGRTGKPEKCQKQKDAQRNCFQKDVLRSSPVFFLRPIDEK